MVDISDIEDILKKQHEVYLSTMEGTNFNKIQLILFKSVQGVHSEVYGLDSGEEGSYPAAEITALVAGDSFFPADNASAGTFSEGWLYTSNTLVTSGDMVAIKRKDKRSRKYKVVDLQRIGSSTSVFNKFKLSALGD